MSPRPFGCVFFAVWLSACAPGAAKGPADSGGAPPFTAEEIAARIQSLGPLPALPADPTNAFADDPAAARLGQALFFDPILSRSGTFSCATCHDPRVGFGDRRPLSEAAGTTGRHSPSLWNVGYQRWFFWDGRCDSLWCQAAQPIEAPHEMDGDRVAVVRALSADPVYGPALAALAGPLPDLSDAARFPAHARPLPATPEHPDHLAWLAMAPADQDAVTAVFVVVAKAIAAYERRLVSGSNRVDAYVAARAAGDESGGGHLSAEEEAGLVRFVGEGGCIDCHAGPLYTHREFQAIGLGARPWLPADDHGRYDGIPLLQADPLNAASRWSDDPSGEAAARIGRLLRTGEQDGQFRVPGLRNVADSPPYMHGGHFATLTEVVEHYNRLEEEPAGGHIEPFMEPLGWDADAVAEVVAFLEALSAPPPDPSLLGAAPAP